MTKIFFLWLFAYAFVWWLLWFLVLPLRAHAEIGARSLRRKALVVSLLAVLLTTLLLVIVRRV